MKILLCLRREGWLLSVNARSKGNFWLHPLHQKTGSHNDILPFGRQYENKLHNFTPINGSHNDILPFGRQYENKLHNFTPINLSYFECSLELFRNFIGIWDFGNTILYTVVPSLPQGIDSWQWALFP